MGVGKEGREAVPPPSRDRGSRRCGPVVPCVPVRDGHGCRGGASRWRVLGPPSRWPLRAGSSNCGRPRVLVRSTPGPRQQPLPSARAWSPEHVSCAGECPRQGVHAHTLATHIFPEPWPRILRPLLSWPPLASFLPGWEMLKVNHSTSKSLWKMGLNVYFGAKQNKAN